MDRLLIAERVAKAWNDAGINYAVANGLSDYPSSLGRDLDVVLDVSQAERAMSIARGVLERFDLVVARPPALWGRRLLAADADYDDVLEIHASSHINWRNVVLADEPRPSEQLGPFRIDPWISFAKRVVAPLLAGQYHKLSGPGRRYGASPAELSLAAERLPHLIGPALTTRLLRSLERSGISDVPSIATAMRRAAVVRSTLRHPLTTVRLFSHSLLRRGRQPFTPCAPVVAIVGPDGVGKSTLLETLRTGDSLVFLDVTVRHWRPHVLPALGRFVGRQARVANEDGLYPPRRQPGRFSPMRLAYYYVDFLVGGFLKDRVDSSRQRLVLYDRCFLDMSVDPARFGLASSRGADLLWKLLPRPDLVILLDDEPERIHRRKPELSTDEIHTLYRAWARHVAEGRVTRTLPVTDDAAKLARLVRREIVREFMRKNGARCDAAAGPSTSASPADADAFRTQVV